MLQGVLDFTTIIISSPCNILYTCELVREKTKVLSMVKKRKATLPFRSGFGIGDLEKTVAERDDLLVNYYVGQEKYVSRALNRDDEAAVFIGPKGIGKSAILQMVRLDQIASGNSSRIIEIAPDDLAFNALVNIGDRATVRCT